MGGVPATSTWERCGGSWKPVLRLAATLEELAGLIEGAGGTELNRVKTHVPATRLVRFNLGDALEIQVAHVATHLDKARRAHDDPALPRPA